MFICCQSSGADETAAIVDSLQDENPGKDPVIEQQRALSASREAKVEPEKFAESLPEREPEPAPSEPVREFRVQVEKNAGESANLALDTCAGVVEVCNIGPGPIQRYNDSVNYPYQVQVGDFIVGVNGKDSDPTELLKEFQNDNLDLQVRHPTVVSLKLQKMNGSFGLDLTHAAGNVARSIAICRVIDGPIVAWNRDHSDVQVKKGDRIVAVNGGEGSPEELLSRLQGCETVELQISCA